MWSQKGVHHKKFTQPRAIIFSLTHVSGAVILSLIAVLLLRAPSAHAALLNFVEVKKDGIAGVDGLNGTFSVAISPDGAHVYAASRFDSAVAVFSRDAATGTLSFVEAEKNGAGNVDTLGGATSVAVSPDGAHVYVASLNDSSITAFARNPGTGALSLVEAEIDGVGGTDGLEGAISLALSPDGEFVYAAGFNESAIAVFGRNTTTGALSFLHVYRDNVDGADGIQQPIFITTSPDNKHVYVGGISANDGIAVYSRNITTGALVFVDLYKSYNDGDGLSGGYALAFSPDGLFAYVASSLSLIGFSRNATTGALQHLETFRNSFNGVDGLQGAWSVDVSRDGSNVYVASQSSALAVFSRGLTTGRLSFAEVHKDGIGGVDGLDTAQAVVSSPDSKHVYTGSQMDDAVAVFRSSASQPATSTPTHTTAPTLVTPRGIFLPVALKENPPPPTATATPTTVPTATSAPSATPTTNPGSVWQIGVNDAYQVSQVTCRQGIDTIVITPRPGYALIIVDVRVRNTQTATVSSSSIAVVDRSSTSWEVLASEFSGSYCPSSFVTQYSPGERNSKFAFAVSASSLAQPYSLRFADAAPVTFSVRP